jgi:hypothetical protein
MDLVTIVQYKTQPDTVSQKDKQSSSKGPPLVKMGVVVKIPNSPGYKKEYMQPADAKYLFVFEYSKYTEQNEQAT